MQLKSKLAHLPKAEEKRLESLHEHLVENSATEAQRDRLRSSSINVSDRVKYDQMDRKETTQRVEGPPTKKRRVDADPAHRLKTLKEVMKKQRPNRYDYERWLLYKTSSIETLRPYYPNSTCPKLTPNVPF